MGSESMHAHTPSLSATDGRGLPVRQVDYLRNVAGSSPKALVTRQQYDVAGRLAVQQDPRLALANVSIVYALNGAALYTDSVDSGKRLVLPGPAGEPVQRWDGRDQHCQSSFDEQLRMVMLQITGNDQTQIDTFTYADGYADAGYNRRGQLIQQTDASGSFEVVSYALTGQPVEEIRLFHDRQSFTSRQVFSPLGAVLEQTDAGGHRRTSRFGLAGQLRQMELQVQAQVTQVLQDAQYNANNQIIAQLAGNGVLSQWTYDPTDGRLHTQTSGKTRQSRLQDLEYFYDRVGNIIRIEDHAFEPVWFANQRVDGHRGFSYDSLYRLIRATGHDDALPPDIPGLPQPPDEKNRLNYTQTYSYDDGGNLSELRHQRDGNSRTRTMYIDDNSNRAVRWQTGDEVPDFDALFDPHGNQRKLRHVPALHWNSRDELERVDLVIRPDSANDSEYYQYSAGQRVLKCHEWFRGNTRHFHQVRYLPGLEIRSKDNGEELHIISLGNARCLHWAQRSTPIDDQMRYPLEDHLGSCVMELNEDAVVTSAEGYYPFGETAWMAPESEIEYRFIRYSGKEMDVSGLYYYGARYYAPWLQRWISADPAGDVDGLNLYGFVGNNPIVHVDQTGAFKVVFDLLRKAVGIFDKAQTAAEQLHNLTTEFDGLIPEGKNIEEVRKSMTFGKFITSRAGIKSVFYGIGKGIAIGSVIGTVVPGIGNAIGSGAGAIAGAIVFPVLRYHFFKKGLKAAQTLHTQELKDGLTTLGDRAAKAVDSAKDLLDGGAALIESIKTFTDNLNSYSEHIQKMFYAQLDALDAEKQRQVMKLARNGEDPFEAIDKVLQTAQAISEAPSETHGVTERLQQLERSLAAEPGSRPVPKPRLNLAHRRQVQETAV
ncbi:RHS repeat-associated core domain-containing protein [Pseudomonas moraviensis subsp. stanleyae]|uniref:RHS repeat domain-containing protein n=1 Tax=Pseudomonas moraviensis TaxID=321662 RepID=UPI002E365B85|nr:RHS repeat-associated core domain-containing protein [Pseudomonas moraviensis]MED7667146.1 RHS repeat-associated core domain-containing protein [Pseudomonas moraviensis subsp. stanleyae]